MNKSAKELKEELIDMLNSRSFLVVGFENKFDQFCKQLIAEKEEIDKR